MSRLKKLTTKGFSIAELLVVLSVAAVMLAIGNVWFKQLQNLRGVDYTQEVVSTLHQAMVNTFFDNIKYSEDYCYGWNNGSCANLTLFPIVVNPTTLQFNTFDTNVINMLARAGCIVNGNAPNFTVECYDGWGQLLQFSESNYQNLGSNYTLPYQNQFFSLTVNDPKTNATYNITLDKEITWALSRTTEKVSQLASAIKNYVRIRKIQELGNPCDNGNGTPNDPPGGLYSDDIALIPWIWQATGYNPLTLCSGITDTTNNCGCVSLDNSTAWPQGSNICVLNQQSDVDNFLKNLNLGNKYATDGFGNPLTIVPLADSNGNPINCPPPYPGEYYPVLGIEKTRIGVKDSNNNWVYYVDVIGE